MSVTHANSIIRFPSIYISIYIYMHNASDMLSCMCTQIKKRKLNSSSSMELCGLIHHPWTSSPLDCRRRMGHRTGLCLPQVWYSGHRALDTGHGLSMNKSGWSCVRLHQLTLKSPSLCLLNRSCPSGPWTCKNPKSRWGELADIAGSFQWMLPWCQSHIDELGLWAPLKHEYIYIYLSLCPFDPICKCKYILCEYIYI